MKCKEEGLVPVAEADEGSYIPSLGKRSLHTVISMKASTYIVSSREEVSWQCFCVSRCVDRSILLSSLQVLCLSGELWFRDQEEECVSAWRGSVCDQ